jgi:hypothetical protein
MAKATETVADQFLEFLVRDKGKWTFSGVDGHEKQARELQTRLTAARRFIIDDDAADAAGALARSNAEILGKLLPGARPPAVRTWLEWSDAAQARSTGFSGDKNPHDLRLCALIETDQKSPNRYTVELFIKDWIGHAPGARPDGYVFASIHLGFVVDTDCPLPASERLDEQALAPWIKISPQLLAINMGLPLFGPLDSIVGHAYDPDFYDAHPDPFGYREHRMKRWTTTEGPSFRRLRWKSLTSRPRKSRPDTSRCCVSSNTPPIG